MKWKARKHATYGTMYEFETEDCGWQITFPRRSPEQPTVELRYGRRALGDVVPHVLQIGFFASAGEAMLAARMFSEGALREEARQAREKIGFAPYFEGAEKLEIPRSPRSSDTFLFFSGIGKNRAETGLDYRGGGRRGEHSIARIWSDTMHDADFMPVPKEKARAVEETILMELFRIRMERGPKRYAEPMTVEEFRQWEAGRYEPAVDPDGHRPYSQAPVEIRNEAARELLLNDAALRTRLGISPGYEELRLTPAAMARASCE